MPDIRGQGPRSKAARAAAIARRVSSGLPAANSATLSRVAPRPPPHRGPRAPGPGGEGAPASRYRPAGIVRVARGELGHLLARSRIGPWNHLSRRRVQPLTANQVLVASHLRSLRDHLLLLSYRTVLATAPVRCFFALTMASLAAATLGYPTFVFPTY